MPEKMPRAALQPSRPRLLGARAHTHVRHSPRSQVVKYVHTYIERQAAPSGKAFSGDNPPHLAVKLLRYLIQHVRPGYPISLAATLADLVTPERQVSTPSQPTVVAAAAAEWLPPGAMTWMGALFWTRTSSGDARPRSTRNTKCR
jgi:hypothetical protein